MQILIAEDEPVSRERLKHMLVKWGYDVFVACDGDEAWGALQHISDPAMAILDWMMPGLAGLEICRRLRAKADRKYIIMLTAKDRREDILEALEAGADDYVIKPFDPAELRARVRAGVRVTELQQSLADRVKELEEAFSQIKTLEGLIPICSYCKKIRDDGNYWQQLEGYLSQHAGAKFTHGICPDCFDRMSRE